MTRMVRTACPLNCWDGCGWLVEARGRQVLAVRGDPDHEITRGFVCPKAQYQVERHHSARRLRFPLRRTPGGWQEASWESALDELAEAVDRSRRRHGTLSIMSYWDSGSMGLLKRLDQRFWNQFGPITVPAGSLCWSAGLAAQQADFGANLAHDPVDHANARFILIWGRNPLDTNTHLRPFLKVARDNGARLVVVDPVSTATARDADLHLAVRPGSDLILALSLGHTIIEEGLADEEFLGSRVRGFEDYRRLCRQFPPERVEEQTGVKAGLARDLAREYAGSRPAAILLGYGLQRYATGGAAVRAVDALAAITGNIGIPGGGASYATTYVASCFADLSGEAPAHRQVPRVTLARQLLELDDPPVRALVVARSNPASQLPRTRRVLEALAGLDFLAVIDFTLTDTAEVADLVLPATTVFEEEDIYFCSWHSYLTYGEAAVEADPGCRSDLAIYGALADRLGLGRSFGSDRPAREWIADALRPLEVWGLTPGRLRGRSLRHPGAPLVPWQDGGFATPSGKLELLPAAGGLPSGPPEDPYPFRLITPRHRQSIHSQFYDEVQAALDLPASGPPAVLIDEERGRGLGLDPGEGVRVISPWGDLACQARFIRGSHPDALVIYAGGRVGSSCANVLTPDRLTDIGLGAAYYECPCRLEREGTGERSL
ncbi:MAG: molybdopterin-dependent oxidoreductase [bacterium]|nr:molybdopterin-dependent oxidoreductase [bacterium]